MSTEGETDDLRERVNGFLERNFPQIWMHGGTAAIEHLDPETGEVSLSLGGACSGCGISPMTVQAIKSRMASEIPEIQTVHANAAGGSGSRNRVDRKAGVPLPGAQMRIPTSPRTSHSETTRYSAVRRSRFQMMSSVVDGVVADRSASFSPPSNCGSTCRADRGRIRQPRESTSAGKSV